ESYMVVMYCFFFFFFSSRRRHTRCYRDWSSDVCSSDLGSCRTDGTFLGRGIPPGSYKIRVSAPGFVTKYFSATAAAGVLTLEDGSFVNITAGTKTPSINVALDPNAGTLMGTVRQWDTLQPIEGAVVEYYGES